MGDRFKTESVIGMGQNMHRSPTRDTYRRTGEWTPTEYAQGTYNIVSWERTPESVCAVGRVKSGHGDAHGRNAREGDTVDHRRGLLHAAVRSIWGGGGHFNTVNRTLVTATNGHSGNTKKKNIN